MTPPKAPTPPPTLYLKAIGYKGGKANSDKQKKQRREIAVKAMLHAKFPYDSRWFPEKK